MAFLIESAKGHAIKADALYFFDSNIWIKIITSPQLPSHKDRIYQQLFEKVILNKKAKIVVPLILMSEVINRILRDVYMVTYANAKGIKGGIPPSYFKMVFRPTAEYLTGYHEIIDEFKTYGDHIIFVNDGFSTDVDTANVLDNVCDKFDFNDNFYFELAKSRGYYVVTDDGDFWREDVKIITQNADLLAKQAQKNMEAFAKTIAKK